MVDPVAYCAAVPTAPFLIHLQAALLASSPRRRLVDQRDDLGLETLGVAADKAAGQVMPITIKQNAVANDR